jgi:hypothetical protein
MTATTTFTFDYTGRKVDVLAFDGATRTGEVLLQQTLAQPGEGGKITAGIQKLAQRFLLELLTKKGTLRYQPSRGTNFLVDADMGYLRTQLDVYGSFARALDDIEQNLLSDETEADPLDERYGGAAIESIATSPGVAKLYVALWSLAGEDRKVTIPITLSL